MKINAIIFDLDDTLIVDEAVSGETFATLAKSAAQRGADAARLEASAMDHAHQLWGEGDCHGYCRSIGISAYECLWGNFADPRPELQKLHEWAQNFRVEVFAAALRDQGVEDPGWATELAAEFARTRRERQRLMPGARELLTGLSEPYKLGMLTNGAPGLQLEKIEASGLAPFFQTVIVSGEHGIGKPKPEIFQRVLDNLGVTSEEAVMVGNSMERDIAGAQAAGITAVWLRVAGAEEPADCHPDHTIDSLAELPPLIEKISG